MGALCGLIFPVLYFYLLEAYTHNGLTEVRAWSQLFNMALFELAAWILFFLLGNMKYALRLEGILALAVGLANYYVYTFRSTPIVPWDLLSVKTAASVADNYDFSLPFRVIAVILLFVILLFLARLAEWKIRCRWYLRLPVVLVICLVLGAFSHVLQQEDFQNRHRMYNKLFTPVYMWQVNGFVLTFVMDLPYLSVQKPSGYHAADEQKLLESYQKQAEEDAKDETAANDNTDEKDNTDEMPNLIVIMDEAFSDLGVLGDFEADRDPIPFVHSLMDGAENTISGYLNVSVCGGNTANTEFEFLTGNTMAFLPQGSVPYQQYVKQEIPALPSYLKSLGYDTCAMHPYYAGGWDRSRVYPLLGFDDLAFITDFSDRTYIRNYISDQSCVNKIIRTYEEKEDGKPAFIFNVTMQNHGSYNDAYENFTPDISVEGTGSYALSSYLSLISKTDQALQELIRYFSEAEEPVMIVFFGDHQPNDTVAEPILRLNGMSSATLTEEERDLRYQVPYVIWANYDIAEEQHADTSANYLAMKVLKAAGIPLNGYQKFEEELADSYPVISAQRILGADGTRSSADADGEELDVYRRLQYYQLFGTQR